jgi:hypothetical protein
MTAYIWCEFVCDMCAHTISGTMTKGAIPRREMTAFAKAEGWKFTKPNGSYCKKCTEKREASK